MFWAWATKAEPLQAEFSWQRFADVGPFNGEFSGRVGICGPVKGDINTWVV